jgi:hypothetical protein
MITRIIMRGEKMPKIRSRKGEGRAYTRRRWLGGAIPDQRLTTNHVAKERDQWLMTRIPRASARLMNF